MNEVFGSYWHRKLFFRCSSKTTFLNSRIVAALTKMQQYSTCSYRSNPQFYTATRSAEGGNCWNHYAPRQ